MSFPAMNSHSAAVVAFFVLSIMFAAAVWVYSDAKAHVQRGNAIVLSWGGLNLSTPAAWFCACLLMGELFVPVYIDNRGLA
jgi:hypothetical protein